MVTVLRIRGFALPDGELREDLRAHLAAGVTMIRSPAWPVTRRQRQDSPGKDWYLSTATVHPALVAAAAEAGVRILAGTDSRPHGRVADEIRALASAGLRPVDAIAAGSWAARSYLGLGGLSPGATADAVVYDADPRADLTQLDTPRAVILRGRCVYRRSLSRTAVGAPGPPAIPLVRC